MSHSLDELGRLASFLADEAGLITRKYFRSDFSVDTKDDLSPVTVADREIEKRLRELVKEYRPGDGIIGEEFGVEESATGYTWVFDPIDGTKSFTIGRPTFGTLIGLCQNDVPVVGVIDQAIINERWVGVEDEPTMFNGRPVHARACPSLDKAVAGTGSAAQIGADVCTRLEAAAKYMVYQGDCYFYGLLANGWMDCIVEHKLGVYDYIALAPVIQGAGGRITDWSGQPLTLHSGESCVASGDPALHAELLALLK